MKKFTVIAIILTLIIVIGGVSLLSKGQVKDTTNYPLPLVLTYYWGDGCPHCKKVADFLSTWNKKDTIKLDKKEVWNNVANAKELKARYTYCQVPQSQMGVPLLFTPNGKCYSGDAPIIEYFKSL